MKTNVTQFSVEDKGELPQKLEGFPAWNRTHSEGVEQQIGVEAVELDHDAGGDREPDRSEDGGCGEELLHGEANGKRAEIQVRGSNQGRDSRTI